jgi:hypothetical protein
VIKLSNKAVILGVKLKIEGAKEVDAGVSYTDMSVPRTCFPIAMRYAIIRQSNGNQCFLSLSPAIYAVIKLTYNTVDYVVNDYFLV